MDNSLDFLATRAGFNTALRHFKSVNGFAADINDGYNLADAINVALAEGAIERSQIRSTINALLVDKFAYEYRTHNLENTVSDVSELTERVSTWGRVQYILCYFDPHAGMYVVNPANADHWEGVTPLIQDEYMVLYVGAVGGESDRKFLRSAADAFMKLLYGKTVKDDAAFVGRRKELKPEPVQAPKPTPTTSSSPSATGEAPDESESAPRPAGHRRMTPRYSVLVTNELFHNGNVEAWKRIVASYNANYPDLEVLIWYENERIHDINALFKWGKVKHGYPIMFSVAGDNIRDVRKLQRYLYEGASPRFEAFLKGSVDRVLDLF